MNLIIEQGNTSSKVAVYENGEIEAYFVRKRLELSFMEEVLREHHCERGILSTVIDLDEKLVAFLEKRLRYLLVLDEHVALPIEVMYKTPATLGKDRLAAVVGAYTLKPACNVLVIDAGTAITYELLDASGRYLGGNISPGLATRFKALNHYTRKLPLVSEPEVVPALGTDTITAIQAGVVKGIVYEMDGYIDEMKAQYPDLFVFLTGGHSFYFERRLKNYIFADINLVLIGLNRILEYNVEN